MSFRLRRSKYWRMTLLYLHIIYSPVDLRNIIFLGKNFWWTCFFSWKKKKDRERDPIIIQNCWAYGWFSIKFCLISWLYMKFEEYHTRLAYVASTDPKIPVRLHNNSAIRWTIFMIFIMIAVSIFCVTACPNWCC